MSNKTEKMNNNENGAPVVLLGEADFETEVLRSKQTVLVAFWAPWSRPCQVLDPILQELASTLTGKARVVRVNADESLGLSLLYEIQSVPTLLYLIEGKPRLRIVGTATKDAILAKLNAFAADRQPGKEN
jgi:thioredoxin